MLVPYISHILDAPSVGKTEQCAEIHEVCQPVPCLLPLSQDQNAEQLRPPCTCTLSSRTAE